MTLSSNLIKKGDHPRFRISAFEAKEMAGRGNPQGEGTLESAEEGKPSQGQTHPTGQVRERIELLEREAYEKGFEQGQKDGMALGEKRVEQTLLQLEGLLASLMDGKKQLYREAEGELLQLSMEIAKQIIRKEIEGDREVIARSVRSALGFLSDKSMVRVLISPEDLREVRRLSSDLSETYRIGNLQVAEDKSIRRGGCIIETGFGRINATIDDQLAELAREMTEEFEERGLDDERSGEEE
jgi:flagellar assembly protein FliH